MFHRFRYDGYSFMLVLVALLLIVLTCQAEEEGEFGDRLAHECVNLHSIPMEGDPVIMLHGLTDMKETWDGIYQNIPILAHRRACIYDARNHGDSPWNDTFNIDILADDLGSFMLAKKIEKAALIGHSLGGLTSMKFALRNPSKVERLVVEDISPVGIPDHIMEMIATYLKILTDSVSAIPDDADEETAKKAVSDYVIEATKEPPPQHLFKRFPFRRFDGRWQWKANFDAFIKSLQTSASFVGKMEGQYNGKTLFIYGKESAFKIENDAEGIRRLFPKAEFFGVEGADHVVHPQRPEYLSEVIKFLKGYDCEKNADGDFC